MSIHDPILYHFSLFYKLISFFAIFISFLKIKHIRNFSYINTQLLQLLILIIKLFFQIMHTAIISLLVFQSTNKFQISFSINNFTQFIMVEELFELVYYLLVFYHFSVQLNTYIFQHFLFQVFFVCFHLVVELFPLFVNRIIYLINLILERFNLVLSYKLFYKFISHMFNCTFICF